MSILEVARQPVHSDWVSKPLFLYTKATLRAFGGQMVRKWPIHPFPVMSSNGGLSEEDRSGCNHWSLLPMQLSHSQWQKPANYLPLSTFPPPTPKHFGLYQHESHAALNLYQIWVLPVLIYELWRNRFGPPHLFQVSHMQISSKSCSRWGCKPNCCQRQRRERKSPQRINSTISGWH